MRLFLAVSLVFAAAAVFAQTPPPPDVAAPPADAQKTASGLASKVLDEGHGHDHPTEDRRGHGALHRLDDRRQDVRQLGARAARRRRSRCDRVIAGWTEGVQLMVVGEKRRFWIPESLAYKGLRDPKGMLVFDVELFSFAPRRRSRRPT